MTQTPRISVILPAYNAEKTIIESIDSVLNQTFADFEFIIINDGSTDNTANIIKEYAKEDKRIKFIDNKKNQGIVPVLNQGIDLCRGEYIARMDSDDISLPTRFGKQIEYMEKHAECGVLGTNFQCFGNSSDVVQKPKRIKILNIIKGQFVGHPTVMLRKSIIDKYNFRYDVNYKHAEDF